MLTSVGISLLSLMVASSFEADVYLERLALTPPMGWNSWSCYGLTDGARR